MIDEDILREEGVRDFDQYAIKPGEPLMPDFFLVGSQRDFPIHSKIFSISLLDLTRTSGLMATSEKRVARWTSRRRRIAVQEEARALLEPALPGESQR